MNILRTPLWGRAFETYGEDPYLTARMGVEWIRGLQAQGVIANVKHFAANNQEGKALPIRVGRSRFTVDAVRRRAHAARDLPAAVRGGGQGGPRRVGDVLLQPLNGAHSCENRTLLDGILRRDWGFKGFVLADYGASKRVTPVCARAWTTSRGRSLDCDGGENSPRRTSRRRWPRVGSTRG